jgi:ArsR family transcriptional regulator
MELNNAVDALGALAQETRLTAFRLLVRAGPAGVPAGEIARELDVPAATMSFHLAHLARAGLISPKRDGRSIIYTADFDGMRGLIDYLSEDCCAGWPQPPEREDANETMTVGG